MPPFPRVHGDLLDARARGADVRIVLSALDAVRAKTVDVALDALAPMLRRLIGDHVRVELVLDARPGVVHLDRGLLEQAVVNLALNARDAMPAGGTLTGVTLSASCRTFHDAGAAISWEWTCGDADDAAKTWVTFQLATDETMQHLQVTREELAATVSPKRRRRWEPR